MNAPAETSPPPPQRDPNHPETTPARRPLTAALIEAGDAVQSELRQANQLAESLDAQLAGKSKEVLHLKFVLNQTKTHFGHLQDSVMSLRQERHKLANDSMKAQGLEMMLARVTTERDRLKTELLGVLEKLAIQNAQPAPIFDKRDQTIAELTFELVKLRQEVADLRRINPSPATAVAKPPTAPASLKPLTEEDSRMAMKVEIIPTDYLPGKRARG